MRYVITGANRGIGLEFTKQLTARGEYVEAGARSPQQCDELNAICAREPARLRIHNCDVASDTSVRAFASAVGDTPIDVIINNAGVMGKMQSLEDLDLDDLVQTMQINAIGAIRITRALLPNLKRGVGRKIVHISSGMGSISDNTSGGAYAYRMSKAALNMASRSMSLDLKSHKLISVVFNPGWVQTDMGGPGATTPVSESVSKMIGIIDRLTLEQSGTFIDFRGHNLMY